MKKNILSYLKIIDLEETLKEIPLTHGKVALIDDEDFEIVSLFKWFARKDRNTFYAFTHVGKITFSMHRLILNLGKGQQGDHWNRNGLDNQKINLRRCTKSQNQMNKIKQNNTSSKYKGVHWRKDVKKWQTRIKVNRNLKHIGLFHEEDAAGQAYNFVAKELFGEFARLNPI